jgi:hypothetical protein
MNDHVFVAVDAVHRSEADGTVDGAESPHAVAARKSAVASTEARGEATPAMTAAAKATPAMAATPSSKYGSWGQQ